MRHGCKEAEALVLREHEAARAGEGAVQDLAPFLQVDGSRAEENDGAGHGAEGAAGPVKNRGRISSQPSRAALQRGGVKNVPCMVRPLSPEGEAE